MLQEMVSEMLQLRSWNTSLEAEKDALVENVAPLQEQIRELERNEELLTDARASLTERLTLSEEAEERLNVELEQSQDATAAVVSELDRLRASVEEIVLQRAVEAGVARVKVIDGAHRKSESALLGERQHLTMEGTPLKPESMEPVQEARTKNNGANSGHRARSILAFTMRPGF